MHGELGMPCSRFLGQCCRTPVIERLASVSIILFVPLEVLNASSSTSKYSVGSSHGRVVNVFV